jgi:hypothetical protein
LLVTTFQSHGRNLKEAQFFKQAALASKLLIADRTNEMWPVPAELTQKGGQAGILPIGSTDTDRIFGFLQLSTSNGKGWSRIMKYERTKLEQFLRSLYDEPIDCWLIGGHHHLAPDSYKAMSWGTDYHADSMYRPYVGFGIDKATNILEWFGFRVGTNGPIDIPMTNAAATLRRVCLMMIMGCNGVPRKRAGSIVFDDMAKAWRTLTKPSLILGWFGVHTLALDKHNRHASTLFWNQLAVLKRTYAIADGAIAKLVADHPDDVIEAWGKSCYEAYSKKDQSHLWYRDVGGLAVKDARGAGAIRPDGQVFHANPKYAGLAGTAAMLPVSGVVVP